MKQRYDVIYPNPLSQRDLPPIIFLHGTFDCRRTWKKVGPVIANTTGRKAYAPDARNHGESPRSEEMNYDVLTEDLEDFMDELGIFKAVIVGHSMGGRTAMNFALKHPERIEALVVEDMTPRNVKSGSKTFLRMLLSITKEFLKHIPPDIDLETTKRRLLDTLLDFSNQKYIYAEKFIKHYDLDMFPVIKVGEAITTEANLDAIESMMEANALVQNLPEKNLIYDGDSLFLYGEMAFFNLGKDTSITKLFPRAIVRRIEGASHMMHLDSPVVFADAVSRFILSLNFHASKY